MPYKATDSVLPEGMLTVKFALKKRLIEILSSIEISTKYQKVSGIQSSVCADKSSNHNCKTKQSERRERERGREGERREGMSLTGWHKNIGIVMSVGVVVQQTVCRCLYVGHYYYTDSTSVLRIACFHMGVALICNRKRNRTEEKDEGEKIKDERFSERWGRLGH